MSHGLSTVFALLPLMGPAPPPVEPSSVEPGAASSGEREGPIDRGPEPEIPPSFTQAYPLPFAAEELALSGVLETAIEQNYDLRTNAMDVEISEARVLAALGAYDVFLTAGLTGTISKQPQRGSQFAISRGSRTLSGFVGFRRQLETGGSIELRLNASRDQTDQPLNFFDPDSPATTINSYRVAPTLTLTHPLLQGAGLAVNRAAINRAKIAVSSTEAQQLFTAQNIVRDLVSAYWNVLFALRDLDNKRQSVELAQRQLERTNALVRAGRLAPVDAKSVEQALAVRESEVLLAENTLLDASLTLRTSMGQDIADRKALGVIPVTDPVVRPMAVDTSEEMKKALERNPQIRQLDLALASRRIDEIEAANRRLPQLDLSASFTPQGRSVDTLPNANTGEAGSRGSWAEAFRNFFNDDIGENGLLADWTLTGSLTLTWDIQNRGPRGNHLAALGEIQKAELGVAQMRQTVAGQVIRATNSLRTAGKRMDVARISLELSDENLAAEQARFDVGRSTNYDVLLRLEERDRAAAEALSAQIEYLKALVQLQALTSELLPAYGIELR